MKGIILCGGSGTRLYPLSTITNKHLLPVYDKPMLYYPLQTFSNAEIKDVLIVVGKKGYTDIIRLIGNGSKFGLNSVYYAFQEDEGGIGHALALARNFVGDEKVAVILGDNVFDDCEVCPMIKKWFRYKDGINMGLFTTVHSNPENYGVLVEEKNKMAIIEKPKKAVSNKIVTGLYLYPANVFRHLAKIEPSDRNEIEITDLNNVYLQAKRADIFNCKFWVDCGENIDGYYSATEKVKNFYGKKGTGKS